MGLGVYLKDGSNLGFLSGGAAITLAEMASVPARFGYLGTLNG